MLVSGKYYPPLDVKAEESINWTREALQRMERVPAFVRGIARTAVLRHAVEKGHSIVSSSVIDEVMAIFMPQKTAAMAESVAEQLALQTLQADGTTAFICEVCGYVAKGTDPVKCPVCSGGAERFVKIDPAAVEAMVAETVRQLGRVDVFVSSAVYSDREPFLTADMKGFRQTLEVSMFGAYYCLRACCNQMVKQGQGGAAVIVSSPHAQIAFPNAMAYNMAKAAIDQMARTAACELLPHRIRVNICYPGWTDTPGERKFFSEETIQKAGEALPWGRLATSEEVARAVLFLADPASDYITGDILHIDGGLFLPFWSKRDEEGF
jgi:glucose 1-dehydrogenase